jgi:hypothetical protein
MVMVVGAEQLQHTHIGFTLAYRSYNVAHASEFCSRVVVCIAQ